MTAKTKQKEEPKKVTLMARWPSRNVNKRLTKTDNNGNEVGYNEAVPLKSIGDSAEFLLTEVEQYFKKETLNTSKPQLKEAFKLQFKVV
jgi:hypothetical protein